MDEINIITNKPVKINIYQQPERRLHSSQVLGKEIESPRIKEIKRERLYKFAEARKQEFLKRKQTK